jgi:hypothetical protein
MNCSQHLLTAKPLVSHSAGQTYPPAEIGAVSSLSRFPAAPVSPAALDGIEDAPDIAGHLLDARIAFPDLAPVLVDLVVVAGDDLSQISDEACHDPDFASKIIDACSNLGELGGELGPHLCELVSHLRQLGAHLCGLISHLRELRAHLRELGGGRIHVIAKYPRETFKGQLTILVCHLVLASAERNRTM